MRRILLLPIILIATGAGISGAAPLRDLTEADAKAWKFIAEPMLTPNGEWFSYLLVPDPYGNRLAPADAVESEVTLVFRRTSGSTEKRYHMGPLRSLGGPRRPGTMPRGLVQLSGDGHWAAFAVDGGSEDLPTPREGRRDIVRIQEIGAERTATLPDIVEFRWIGKAFDQLLVRTRAKENGRFSLVVCEPMGAERHKFAETIAYTVSPDGQRIAIVDAAGLQIHDVLRDRTFRLDRADASYRQVTWAADSSAIAAIRIGSASRAAIVVARDLGTPTPEVIAADLKLPPETEIEGRLVWRDDNAGLFFSSREKGPPQKPHEKAPRLALWHSADGGPQGLGIARPSRLWYWETKATGEFRALSDGSLNVEPFGRGRFLLGFDTSRFGVGNSATGQWDPQRRDYFLVDLVDGARRKLVSDLAVDTRWHRGPQISPDGRWVVYQSNEGDIVSCQVESGQTFNLSLASSTRFAWEDGYPGTKTLMKEPTVYGLVQAWTDDGQAVIVSDFHDLWLLPLDGGVPRNLTVDGKVKDIGYSIAALSRSGLAGANIVSLAAPLWLSARDNVSGRHGLLVLEPGAATPRVVRWDDAETMYLKARDTDVLICGRETDVECRDFFLVGPSGRLGERLTDANPQQREFRWPPRMRYLTYQDRRGNTLHAKLYLPVGYEPGHPCPTIVWIYEKSTSAPFNYLPFATDRYPWLQRGYAILCPDIEPRKGDAGEAALEAVSAAVDAGVATGIVDRSRLGLSGHSFGGWETYYIVTKTNLFKAAVPYAGMTNLLSKYGTNFEGVPAWYGAEHDQPFLGGPWWDQWSAYVRNSPLFSAAGVSTPLLIVHGNRDTAVPFAQAVEMFFTLTRLGRKDIVLLEYDGEGHQLDWGNGEAELDFRQRLQQFFDHFLRNAPAPAWWTDGRSHAVGEAPIP